MSGVRSMTGFAARAVEPTAAGAGGFRLSIKGVNHRFLDLSLKMPPGYDTLETQLRQALKCCLRRGHVEMTLSLDRSSSGRPVIDDDLLGGYVASFREAARRHGLESEPELNVLLRLPGVVRVDHGMAAELSEAAQAGVVEALKALLVEFDRTREEEGTALRQALEGSLERMRVLAGEARALRAGVRGAHVERLVARMRELFAVAGGEEPPGETSQWRIMTEAALLAERSDVEEELVRLLAHVERFAAVLEEGGEVGKRLDFMAQEMNREANTLLSKTGSAAGPHGLRLTEIGLECKVEIERVREQVQNLE